MDLYINYSQTIIGYQDYMRNILIGCEPLPPPAPFPFASAVCGQCRAMTPSPRAFGRDPGSHQSLQPLKKEVNVSPWLSAHQRYQALPPFQIRFAEKEQGHHGQRIISGHHS